MSAPATPAPDLFWPISTPPRLIAGVDEVGRGPLAGPVTVAAVILNPDHVLSGLDDSKALSEKKRLILFDEIVSTAIAMTIVHLPPSDIDRLNIRSATLEAMRRAVVLLHIPPDLALIDGRDVPPGLPCPARAIVGGDGKEPAISAASIVAKVMRDRLMTRLGTHWPAYAFERHKGYGAAAHLAAIRASGPTPHHRLSFAPFKNGTPRG
jgi:ribonuclease HII